MTATARDRRPFPWWSLGAGLFTLALAGYVIGHLVFDHGTAGGLVVAPVLLVALFPLFRRASVLADGFDLGGMLFAGFSARLIATHTRLAMVDDFYGGNGDSAVYHHFGRQLAAQYRRLELGADPERPIPGTGFIRVLTGAIYALAGSDRFVGFCLFATMAFIGTYFLVRAFMIAVPHGHHERYAALVLFWPSLLFWPSSIGKEAWMMLSLGLAAWGAARLFVHARGGATVVAIGVGAAFLARPHVAILVVAALFVALVMAAFFSSGDPLRSFGFVRRISAAAVFALMGAVLAPRVADFLQVDDVGGSGFGSALDLAAFRTSGGGSTFAAASVDGFGDYPWAVVTVIFRPFLFEADNAAGLVTAAETTMLILALVFAVGRLWRVPLEVMKRPYAAFVTAYIAMFVFVFASISNFGILARQRVQVLPFVFVLLALPLSDKVRERRRAFRHREPDEPPAKFSPAVVGDAIGAARQR